MQENWDHGLMLSGLDLWDGDPESTSVIGTCGYEGDGGGGGGGGDGGGGVYL